LRVRRQLLALPFHQLQSDRFKFYLFGLWDHIIFPNYHNQERIYKASAGTKRSFLTKFKQQNWVFSLRLPWLPVDSIQSKSFHHALKINSILLVMLLQALTCVRKSIGEGIIYLRGIFTLFFFDAMLTDDEPLWEPVEWSLTQS
jgi:hypothetical protein